MYVKQGSVIFVECVGKHVPALNGMKTASLREQRKSRDVMGMLVMDKHKYNGYGQ